MHILNKHLKAMWAISTLLTLDCQWTNKGRSSSPWAIKQFQVVELCGMWNKTNTRRIRDHLKCLLDFSLPMSYQEEKKKKLQIVPCVKLSSEHPEPTQWVINDVGNSGIPPHVAQGVPVLLEFINNSYRTFKMFLKLSQHLKWSNYLTKKLKYC